MDSPNSEYGIEMNTSEESENPSDSENLGLVEANNLFFENLTPEQPPEVAITMQATAETPEGEQSQANSLNRQQVSNPSTVTAASEVSVHGPLIFESLPDKILVKILQLIPRDELDDLKDVSSQFRMLIDGQIGLSITIGSMNSLLLDSSIERLKEIGVASCTVMNLVNIRVPDRPYRYPQLLRSLTLQGYISEKNFIRLISTTPHVQKLQVDISTLSVLEFQDLRLHEHFPNLSVLKITSEGDFFSECTALQWLTACYSLIGLLEETFADLKQFSVSIPFISHFRNVNFDFAKTLFLFLQRHGPTLKRLKIEYGGFYEDIDDDDNENDEEIADVNFYSQQVLLKNLEYFSISLIIDEDDAGLPRDPGRWVQKLCQQWLPIVNYQDKLQSCTVTHSIFFPCSAVATLCLNNKQTLKILHWKFPKQSGGERVVVDCIIFRDCYSLTELVLSGPTSEDLPFLGDDQSWWTRPVFHNLANLPQNLEKLKLDNCEVAVTQFITFPNEFPNLKCLSLDINCHDPWGISVDTLAGLLEKESLKLLILQRSFNSKSLHYNNYNPETSSSVASILKALISSWTRNTYWSAMSTFALRKNANGHWENAGGAIPNLRRDMFPTPMPERVRTAPVFALAPRRVMFDL